MRFKYYITEKYKKEGRGKEISLEEALKISPKYSDAIESGTTIARQMDSWKIQYYLIDPKTGEERVSRNTSNYYTLIMDNSSKWKKYPRRGRSLICSINTSCGINAPHRVFPENGSTIGVCPTNDLWDAFKNSFYKGMNEVNYIINILSNIGMKVKKNERTRRKGGLEKFDKDITTIKKAFKSFDKWYKNQRYNIDILEEVVYDYTNGSDYDIRAMRIVMDKYSGDLYKMTEQKLNPDNNDFRLVTTSTMNSAIGKNEVWTEGKSLMIQCGKSMDDFLNRYGR